MAQLPNPYSGETFFSFFPILIKRLVSFLSGSLDINQLATDEVQVLVLWGIAACAGFIGTFLYLRKQTMLANALSHTMLLGIVLSYLILTAWMDVPSPEDAMNPSLFFLAAILTGIVTTFLTDFFSRRVRLQEEASIGLVFTTLFAAGILVVTMATRNIHLGTELITGNVDALKVADLKNIYLLLFVNKIVFVLFYRGIKLTTFDSSFAKAQGFSPSFYHYLLMVLTSLTSIGAFRAVGVMMVLAFFVIPPLTARLLTHRLSVMIALSTGIGCLGALISVALSRHIFTYYHQGLSTGGICVCVLSSLYILVLLLTSFISSPRRTFLTKANPLIQFFDFKKQL